MDFKKMGRVLRIIVSILYIFLVIGIVGLIGLMIYFAFIDEQVVTNTVIMNRITLLLAGLSLPGLVIQLVSLLTINEKKTFALTTKCPHCRHLVELKMKED
ncbi:hypothetical protein [Paenibacillus sp. SER-28]